MTHLTRREPRRQRPVDVVGVSPGQVIQRGPRRVTRRSALVPRTAVHRVVDVVVEAPVAQVPVPTQAAVGSGAIGPRVEVIGLRTSSSPQPSAQSRRSGGGGMEQGVPRSGDDELSGVIQVPVGPWVKGETRIRKGLEGVNPFSGDQTETGGSPGD